MKKVVETVKDKAVEISLDQARLIDKKKDIDDIVNVEVTPKNFGRIAAQKAKQVVVQKYVKKSEESFMNITKAKSMI